MLRSCVNVDVPPRVQAAQQYLWFIQGVTNPGSPLMEQGSARDLSRSEEVVYEAALEVMRLYFSGEESFEPAIPDFADAPLPQEELKP